MHFPTLNGGLNCSYNVHNRILWNRVQHASGTVFHLISEYSHAPRMDWERFFISSVFAHNGSPVDSVAILDCISSKNMSTKTNTLKFTQPKAAKNNICPTLVAQYQPIAHRSTLGYFAYGGVQRSHRLWLVSRPEASFLSSLAVARHIWRGRYDFDGRYWRELAESMWVELIFCHLRLELEIRSIWVRTMQSTSRISCFGLSAEATGSLTAHACLRCGGSRLFRKTPASAFLKPN